MKRFLLACGCCLLTSPIADACINDSELPQREREFRSQYMNETYTQNVPMQSISPSPIYKAGGMGLLCLAGFVAFRRDED